MLPDRVAFKLVCVCVREGEHFVHSTKTRLSSNQKAIVMVGGQQMESTTKTSSFWCNHHREVLTGNKMH